VNDQSLVIAPKLNLAPGWCQISPDAIAQKETALAASALIGKVTTPEQNSTAGVALARLQAMCRSLEKQRKEITDPFVEAQRLVKRMVDEFKDEAERESARVEGLMKEFALEEKRRAREEAEAQQRELERIERERLEELKRIADEQAAREAEARRIQDEADRKVREAQEAAAKLAAEATNKKQREAAEKAAEEASKLALQTFQDEQEKYRLGASTSYNVVLRSRDVTTAQGTELRDRINLLEDELKFNQAMGRTLEVNRISLADALKKVVD